eukprot:scaffold49570_cov63-Phaeocystis_antarctica.AAC.3
MGLSTQCLDWMSTHMQHSCPTAQRAVCVCWEPREGWQWQWPIAAPVSGSTSVIVPWIMVAVIVHQPEHISQSTMTAVS